MNGNASVSQRDVRHMLAHTAPLWPALAGARVLLSGGTGFVGAWLLEAFVAANRVFRLGASVTIVSRGAERFRERASHLADNDALSIHAVDVERFDPSGRRFDAVIHMATVSPRSDEAEEATLERDARATQYMLDIAVASRARFALFTSSGAVYGEQPNALPEVDEEYVPTAAVLAKMTPYARRKRRSERMCATYAERHGLEVRVARLFTFAGAFLPLDRGYAFGNFMNDVMAGRRVDVTSDGTAIRSYLYGADLAIWLWTILIRGRTMRPYNVGSDRAISIGDLARSVARAGASRSPVVFGSPALGATKTARYVPCVERARRELGLAQRIALPQAIERTYEYYHATR